MIPILPEGMSEQEYLAFYDTLSGNLSDQSTIHVHWWTHRQNPSVCWICDMVTLVSKILDIAQRKYTKSTVDIETYESLEEDSDSEIENLNVDEEGSTEPEYELEDDLDISRKGESD